MVEQETHDFPMENCERSESHSAQGEVTPEESASRWEGYSLSILSIFFENC